MGLDLTNPPEIENEDLTLDEVPIEIRKLITNREEARKQKNWEESDKLRKLIAEKGYKILDYKDKIGIQKIA